ncbi:hypothetical protein MMC10_004848 [Thelotrema lepadinum]|nr:hypothetical protein [Thelotrema lepadinum]
MPPFVARKRRASTPPIDGPSVKKPKTARATKAPVTSSVQDKKKFLDSLAGSDDSSLSDADSDDFEDVMPSTTKKAGEGDSESDEEDMDWEDALEPKASASALAVPTVSGTLELTLGDRNETVSYMDGKKKGPSKLDRQKRLNAHRMHVQFLMFHNCIRNAWICDKETQEILVAQLPSQMQEVVKAWRKDCGSAIDTEGTKSKKGKDKDKNNKVAGTRNRKKEQRDWGIPAKRLEEGTANLSHGDPTIRLLKYLAKYWQKRFHVTAPGLRKQGYKSVRELQKEMVSFRRDKHNTEEHGERVTSIKEFRQCAKRCEGSRDVGAQLFTALVRGLGVEARLVANLQPIGFGWNKNEEALPKRKGKGTEDSLEEMEVGDTNMYNDAGSAEQSGGKLKASTTSTRKAEGALPDGSKETPFDLSSDSELSEIISESDDSIMEIVPSPKKKTRTRRYDRDLKFPIYWTEVISPISHKVFPVDPMIIGAPATTEEQLMAFEPRGSKAEKAKQVIAYVIAHSADGTAKDVTTRYLKRHMWPGKTKGTRIPPEKVPIYNKRGKVKRYEEYDWFKTVISGYRRRDNKRTPADDIEDATDLKPATIEKKTIKEGEESLQWYKQSADFCLERLLKREEALVPGAESVKIFKSGKGDNAKEDLVFRRQDVVPCKTEESWHKEGRQPKPGAEPLKYAPYRAVTTSRKREVEELTRRNNGVKPMQGLYSKEQTEYIIPPPIENGIIPKNKFGNMDCFVPRMVPKGAVHVPYRGLVKICKKLEIDYAEAVTGFEFGNRLAVPVIQGVIVAAEHEQALIEAGEEEEAKRQVREDQKRQTLILSTWRKFLMGLRILEKMRNEYGTDDLDHAKDAKNPFTNPNKIAGSREQKDEASATDMQGGFVLDDEHDEVEEDGFGGDLEVVDTRQSQYNASLGGGFMTATSEESSDKVFDKSHEDSRSSGLSSHDEKLTDEDSANDVSDTELAAPKRVLASKKVDGDSGSTSLQRRSARTSGQKSKYFDSDSHDSIDDQGDRSSEEEVLVEVDEDRKGSTVPTSLSKRTQRRTPKAEIPGYSKDVKQSPVKKGRGRGRPRKTI